MVKSMFAAVAGLRTHQARMDVIGNNIANVNTYGFKKARATFRDQFYQTLSGASEAGNVYGGRNPSQVGYGVLMSSVDVNYGTGSGAPTGWGTDVMIAGNGFFVVGQYNANGVDRVSNSLAEVGNLTQLNLTRVGIFDFDGSGNFVDSMGNYVYGFLYNSAYGEGGLYDPAATGDFEYSPDRLEMLHVPQVLMRTNGTAVLDINGNFIPIPYETNAGVYVTDDYGQKILDWGAISDILDELDEEFVLPEEATETEPATVYNAAMKLNNISVGADGLVRGTNDLGQVVRIGIIAVANVPNPNALVNIGNGYYKAESNTGVVTGEHPGEGSTGQLNAGYLEMANVDLAQEFTDMITTQRGFQANGRIITVTDEMLAELVNLKR